MHFTGQVYRHPIEAQTPLLEVTAGCSHNKCSFCTMYRETPFKISPLNHVEEDLQELAATGQRITRIFLVNGEPFILSFNKLKAIAEMIHKYLPEVNTITCYASIKSIKHKTLEELKALRALKFNDLHVGLESAYDPAIKQMNKGFTSAEAWESIDKIVKAGFDWDAILMTGVAGKGNGNIHIEETAKLLNAYPPYLVSLMPTSVADGTPLEKMRNDGEFIECTEREKLEEEKYLLKLLECDKAFFFGAHYYNLVPVNGHLSKKDEIIDYIDKRMQKLDPELLDSSFQRDNI